MSRALAPGLSLALRSGKVAPIYLVQVDWPDATLYLWTGYGDITWNSHTWRGVGEFGTISGLREVTDGTANGFTLTLSGISTANLTEALRADIQGSQVSVYIALWSDAGFALQPHRLRVAFVDVPTISDDGKTATISIQCEQEMIDTRSSSRRYTFEDHQIDYPGDTGFQFVAGLASKSVKWGAA